MRYNVHVLDEASRFGGSDIGIFEAESALEAIQHGRMADLERHGRVDRVDTRDWVAKATPDGSAIMCDPGDDGRFCIVADPVDESN